MERSFEFTVISANDGTSQKKSIRLLRADELKDYKSLGSGTGSLMEAFARGSRHCKDFSSCVVGYALANEEVTKQLNDALNEGASSGMKYRASVYAFYEKA